MEAGRMFKFISPHIIIALLAISHPSFAQQRAIDFGELDATVSEELKATNTPGASVVVVVGDRVVFAKGFGVANAETGERVTPNTLFRIASTTKMLTAAALVTLAEQGKIKLDAPVGNYVKGLSPKLSRVTLHQLLSHTAGIRDGFSFHGPHDDTALADFVRSWTDAYLIVEPGEIFSYSNLGYALAGRVLEEITGKPYADAMNEVLFQPLGMRRTTLRPITAMTYPLAQGHDISAGQTNLSVVRPFADDARFWANGGVFTSISDYSRFAIAFLNSGKVEGEQVLQSSVIAKLSAPQVEMPGGNPAERPRHGYGLNVRDYRGARVLQHGGLRVGFGSLVRIVPEHRFAVIILTNKTNSVLLRSLEKATELAVPLQPKPAPPPKHPVTITDAEMKNYAGAYENAPDYLRMELAVIDGKLFLKQTGANEKSEVVKVGDNIFTAGGQEFLLISGGNGKAKYMHIVGHALKRM
jgi:CubicO group peptidase (beta-lactamase class C family)